mgnify:FL=1
MNMKEYEKQAKELAKQAHRLEATMLTLKALESCVRNGGHKFEFWADDADNWAKIGQVQVVCSVCGCEAMLKGADLFFREENEEGWGDLAGKKLKDIEVDASSQPPEEEEVVEETPPVKTAEVYEKDESGTYRVNVEEMMKRIREK